MEKFELHYEYYKEPTWNGVPINPLIGNYQKEYTEWLEDEIILNSNEEIEPLDIEEHEDIIINSLRNYREYFENQLALGKEIIQNEKSIEQIDKAIKWIIMR